MLNIFGAFGRLLPGYIQGEREAIKDNWNDLNQYNDVQAGQIKNAWNEAAFQPNLTMLQHAVDQSQMNTMGLGMDFLYKAAQFPGQLQLAESYSALGPAAYQAQLLSGLGMFNPGGFSNLLGQGMGLAPQQPAQAGALNTPSALQWR